LIKTEPFFGIEMRIDGIGNWVLMLMATASLIIMIVAFSLQSIVSNELNEYGLQFSYDWAIPYWNFMGIIFAMAWLNIIAAIAFQAYRIITIRKEERQSNNEEFGCMPGSEYEQAYDEENMENYGITIVADQAEWQEPSE
jgi:hypothetical protein